MQSPHVASKRIASKASLSGVAFVAAALAAAQSTPNQSQPDALELLRTSRQHTPPWARIPPSPRTSSR